MIKKYYDLEMSFEHDGMIVSKRFGFLPGTVKAEGRTYMQLRPYRKTAEQAEVFGAIMMSMRDYKECDAFKHYLNQEVDVMREPNSSRKSRRAISKLKSQ